MKTIVHLMTLTLAVVAFALPAMAQNPTPAGRAQDPDFSHPLTLAAAPAEPAGGGSGAQDEAAKHADLVKDSLNPVAELISVPLQNNWDFGIGPEEATRYTLNIQPVIPVTLNKEWNLIVRTILPVIDQESRFPGDGHHSGLGDTLQSFFLSPKAPVGGWILGGGPALLYPTATDSALGTSQWGAGPTVVALRQESGWTYGVLVNHIWSFAGWGEVEVNATFLEPFVAYSTKTYTTLAVYGESTYDWRQDQWTVPLIFSLNQMLQIGEQPISLELAYRYYVEGPSDGPEWGLRFTVTFLFPK